MHIDQCCCTFNKLPYSKHNFYIHWETKKLMWLTSIRYSLSFGGLKPNPQYFQGMPIIRGCIILCTSCIDQKFEFFTDHEFLFQVNKFLCFIDIDDQNLFYIAK